MGTSGNHSCSLRKVKSPYQLQETSQDSSPVGARAKSSSEVEARTSGFCSRADMDLGVPLGHPQGSQSSSRVEICKSSFLSSCNSSVRPHV